MTMKCSLVEPDWTGGKLGCTPYRHWRSQILGHLEHVSLSTSNCLIFQVTSDSDISLAIFTSDPP